MVKSVYDPKADETEHKDILKYSGSFWSLFLKLAFLLVFLAIIVAVLLG